MIIDDDGKIKIKPDMFNKITSYKNEIEKIKYTSETNSTNNTNNTTINVKSQDDELIQKRKEEIETRKKAILLKIIESKQTAQKQQEDAKLLAKKEAERKAKEDEAARNAETKRKHQEDDLKKRKNESEKIIKDATPILKIEFSKEIQGLIILNNKLTSSKTEINTINTTIRDREKEYNEYKAELNAGRAPAPVAELNNEETKKLEILNQSYDTVNLNHASIIDKINKIENSIKEIIEKNKLLNNDHILANDKHKTITSSNIISQEQIIHDLYNITKRMQENINLININSNDIKRELIEIKTLAKKIFEIEASLKLVGYLINSAAPPANVNFPAGNKNKFEDVFNHQVERFRELFVFLKEDDNRCVVIPDGIIIPRPPPPAPPAGGRVLTAAEAAAAAAAAAGTAASRTNAYTEITTAIGAGRVPEAAIIPLMTSTQREEWNKNGTPPAGAAPAGVAPAVVAAAADKQETTIIIENLKLLFKKIKDEFKDRVYYKEIGDFQSKFGTNYLIEPDRTKEIKDTSRVKCGANASGANQFPPAHSESVYHVYGSDHNDWNFELNNDGIITTKVQNLSSFFNTTGLGRFGICTMPLSDDSEIKFLNKSKTGGGRKQIFKQTIKQNFKNKFQKNHTRKSRRF